MYENFFGLTEKPFCVTPDTRFLFPSVQHEEVIRTLEYGIHERKGFLLLTGEVGTGKTTCIRSVLNHLGPNVQTSLILNPLLTTADLIACINRDFGCTRGALSIQALLEALNYFLIRNDRVGKNAVVIIDEAQNLSMEALEMTRLISNLETESRKLIQIVLAGQPELETKLSHPSLRQLTQRIQIYSRLKPFDREQIESYIQHRIRIAGTHPTLAFEKSAIKTLHKISGGIPRIINTVCELALLAAYARQTRIVTPQLVKLAAREAPIHVYHS